MKSKQRIEFGDFQTPTALAENVCRLLRRRRVRPMSILEPTCGEGGFLWAALRAFPDVLKAIGADINPAHVATASARLRDSQRPVRVIEADFFATDWRAILDTLPEPVLVVGNPPWVNNSELSVINSANVPAKRNVDGLRGIEALTGKSNFDVSEWMIIKLLRELQGRTATFAMLCKTSVGCRSRSKLSPLPCAEPAGGS